MSVRIRKARNLNKGILLRCEVGGEEGEFGFGDTALERLVGSPGVQKAAEELDLESRGVEEEDSG